MTDIKMQDMKLHDKKYQKRLHYNARAVFFKERKNTTQNNKVSCILQNNKKCVAGNNYNFVQPSLDAMKLS